MNDPSLERFLATLYTDPEMQARFLADPAGAVRQAGLSAQNCAAVLKINPTELRLAARSFARKRRKRAAAPPQSSTFVQRWIGKFRNWRRELSSGSALTYTALRSARRDTRPASR